MVAPGKAAQVTPVDDVKNYLKLVSDMRAKMPGAGEWAYNGPEAFVLAHGKEYTPPAPGPLPNGIPAGEIKNCFQNAYLLATAWPAKYTYVEGWAAGIIPVHHAWVVDAAGNVVDPTWAPPNRVTPGTAYFGVAFKKAYLERATTRAGYYGLLGQWNGGKHAYALERGKVNLAHALAGP